MKNRGLYIFFIFYLLILSCDSTSKNNIKLMEEPYLIVLGITQDGGYPQAGTKSSDAWDDLTKRKHVACLAIVDPKTSERWMIDATPDFKEQLYFLDQISPVKEKPGLSGICITHAHIGHYVGLMNLGREVMGTKNIPVYTMPKMFDFIRNNGPWDLLVKLNNITLLPIEENIPIQLNCNLYITPILVPHRSEYTETVGYLINGPTKSILYIPDIDKWKDLDELGVKIEDLIMKVDIAYLDGTFYEDGEIAGRSMYDIPHPFIEESLLRFRSLSEKEKRKIRFIHFNHTNPVLNPKSKAYQRVKNEGFEIAEELEVITL